jgi:alkylated DNA repair dioxygenase AlkB
VGWHSDDEPELRACPVIASVSFGAPRTFQLRHNRDKSLKANVELENGSLLLMQGTTQQFYLHQIPKTAHTVGARINLTYRVIS